MEGDESEWEEETRHFVDLTDAVGSHVLADLSASLLVLGAASDTGDHGQQTARTGARKAGPNAVGNRQDEG